MKRFSEQFKKKSESIRLRAAERADLRDRLVSYMEYHPLPSGMRVERISGEKRGISSEPFSVIAFNVRYVRNAIGMLAALLVVAIPVVAEWSVPGDVLYPIKRNINEELRSTLTLSPYAKVEWETKRLERRIAEARLLAEKGELTPEKEAEVVAAVRAHTDAAQQEIAHLRQEDADTAAIAEITFASALEVQSEVLAGDTQPETYDETGSSVDALVYVVQEVVADVKEAVDEATPSYEKLLGEVEAETTTAYELFASVQSQISDEQRQDIERRLADIERKVAEAIALYAEEGSIQATTTDTNKTETEMDDSDATDVNGEESATSSSETTDDFEGEGMVGATATKTVDVSEEVKHDSQKPMVVNQLPVEGDPIRILREALQDVQKLIRFITDLELREAISIDELVPVTLTDEERLSLARDDYTVASALVDEIASYTIGEEYEEKVALGMQLVQEALSSADAAFAAQNVSAAEEYSAQARVFAQDLSLLLQNTQQKDGVTTPEEGMASSTQQTTVDDVADEIQQDMSEETDAPPDTSAQMGTESASTTRMDN